MTPSLGNLLDGIHPHVLQLNVRWAQYRILFTVSDARMRTLSGTANGFFRLLHDTFRDDAFVTLSRLTDKSHTLAQTNLSLQTLVEALEALAPPASNKQARDTLNMLLTKVSAIRAWRNKWLDHIDQATALAKTPLPSAAVVRGDFDHAIELVNSVMAAVGAHLGRAPFDYENVLVLGDANSLLQALAAP